MNENSLLWELYQVDNAVRHYLFGTMHLSTEGAYTHAEKAKKYINLAGNYVGEMDLNESLAQHNQTYFMLEDGKSLADLFKPHHLDKYRAVVSKYFKIDLDTYQNFTPFFISNLLAEKTLVSHQIEGLDYHLWKYAMHEGKVMFGLESFQDQLHIMKNIPLDYQTKAFKDLMSNIPSFCKKIKVMHSYYENQNLKALYKASKKSMGKLRHLMIYGRNDKMLSKLLSISNSRATFFAVGAAHLPGNKGLLAGLKRAGYKVKPIL